MSAAARPHSISVEGPVLSPDDGLMLGNGGFSCSVFQTADAITFRFGRNDVWDRRIDYAANPPPPTHREFVRGVLDEGWTCRSWTAQDAKATKGTKDGKRFLEICQGVPPAMKGHPYPCAKPLGEMRLHVPIDLPGLPRWRQTLHVEDGRLSVAAMWSNGVGIDVEAVISPDDDVFAVRWNVKGWQDAVAPGSGEHRRPPVWCEIVRMADTAGLPPPKAFHVDGRRVAVEQDFPAEATFPKGFKARLEFNVPSAALGEMKRIEEEGFPGVGARWISRDWERTSGEAFVTARTTLDRSFDAPPRPSYADCAAAAMRAARSFWAKVSVSLPGDAFLEDLWYSVGHARRCVLGGRAKMPPGLFMPSTLNDRPIWHGDWHSNYNYQSMFWGCLTADRLDEMRSYFDGARFFFRTGRIIASRYYGMRGSVVPLQGFPVEAVDDYAGAVPLGRMVYQTGWLATAYRLYYRFTLDRKWLEDEGYPVLKDVALFYMDFLKKAPSPDLPPELDDGRYHAFPSIEEETRITGVKDVLDRTEVLAFVRHALWAAIDAAQTLGVDGPLREQWRERLENLVDAPQGLSPYESHCLYGNPPEFGYAAKPYAPPQEWKGRPRRATSRNNFGHSIRSRIVALRENRFVPGRDFQEYRDALERWRRPNGTLRAMAAANWGRYGWTETLSAMAPMQEMMLQSWDGAINIFPWWPKEKDASFTGFRAQGAFLVSASMVGGKVVSAKVVSEKGGICAMHGRWKVRAADGTAVPTFSGGAGFERLQCFKTVPGGEYVLEAVIATAGAMPDGEDRT